MATYNSLQYAKLYVNKYLAKLGDFGGRVMPLPFDFTWQVSPAPAAGDIVNMCVIPANHMLVGIDLVRQAMASTAVTIGDAAVTNRISPSSTWAAAGSITVLDLAAMFFQPTVDTIVIATFVTVAPTASTRFAGCLYVMQAP